MGCNTMNSHNEPTNSQLMAFDKVMTILIDPSGDKAECDYLANSATPALETSKKLFLEKIDSLEISEDDKEELNFWVKTVSSLSLIAGGIQFSDYARAESIINSYLDDDPNL